MNQTGKNCFFFEDKYVNFDRTEGVFTANIVTCSLFVYSLLWHAWETFLLFLQLEKRKNFIRHRWCLAVSDLLVGLVCQPLYVAHKIAELEENFAVFCELKMVQFLSGWTTTGVSFVILAAVSIDRLLALTLHLRYNTIVTVPRVFQTTFVLWMFCHSDRITEVSDDKKMVLNSDRIRLPSCPEPFSLCVITVQIKW